MKDVSDRKWWASFHTVIISQYELIFSEGGSLTVDQERRCIAFSTTEGEGNDKTSHLDNITKYNKYSMASTVLDVVCLFYVFLTTPEIRHCMAYNVPTLNDALAHALF